MSILFSCSTAKYVNVEQSILNSNQINFTEEIDYNNKTLLLTELESFYRQSPNGKLFWFIPREWFYFKNAGVSDTCWYNNWGRSSLGETPVFHNQNMTEETASAMQQFLRNTKGFYQAEVKYDISTDGHKSKVAYNVSPGKRYYINSIDYIGQDASILHILDDISGGSLIKEGDPLEAESFNREKARIISELQNRGYANFLPNYLTIAGDSTNQNFSVDVFLQVLPPLPDTLHRQYKVGKINIYTDYYPEQDLTQTGLDTLNDLIFRSEADEFLVDPRLIASKIFLQKDDLWSIDNYNKTFRKLSDLSTYRFVSMVPSRNNNTIDYDIFLTPHIHQYVTDLGFDVNYSSVNSATGRQLFGISGNALLNIRNPFKGSEQLNISLDNSNEFNLDSLRLSAFTLGFSNTLELPKFYDYLGPPGIVNLLDGLGILSDDRMTNIREESTTGFNLGANYTNIRNFYTISSFNLSANYNYAPSQRKRISIRQTNFSLNTATLRPRFLSQIGENQLIINSFADNLITGFLFNEVSFVANSTVSSSGWSRTLIGSFEISGLEVSLANAIGNAFGENKTWTFFGNTSFAKFVKAEIDSRFYKRLSRNSNLALRVNGGIAIPFGHGSTIPFIRQFSVGGPNSLRAWNQKELGPGGFDDFLRNPPTNQAFFQQGDIKLELNAEYRFNVAWILEGALFMDAGNVWTYQQDTTRENAQFTSNFYKQFAIAAGYGMRFDFEYFNIRFDFAYRLRNPYPEDEENDTGYWYSWQNIKDQGFGNLQVAVNYPF